MFLAETLISRGRDADRDEARTHLETVSKAGRRTGATLFATRAEEALRNLDVDTRDRKSEQSEEAPLPAGLTDREAEVLKQVTRGLTNKEIGASLFISTKTVSTHVHNILEKIGAANRAEATAYAMRNGLIDA